MSIPPDSRASVADARHEQWLLGLSFLGPMLWFVALVLLYWLTEKCRTGAHIWTWLTFGLCSAGAMASLLALLQRQGAEQQPYLQFIARAGIALGGLSLVLLVGFLFPLLGLNLCE
jgi:hypothetical protein